MGLEAPGRYRPAVSPVVAVVDLDLLLEPGLLPVVNRTQVVV